MHFIAGWIGSLCFSCTDKMAMIFYMQILQFTPNDMYVVFFVAWLCICSQNVWDCNSWLAYSQCHYNAVQNNTIFHTALRRLTQNITRCQITNCTPYLTLTGYLWGVFCADSVEKNSVIMAPHCISFKSVSQAVPTNIQKQTTTKHNQAWW